MSLSILSTRRVVAPFGLMGGGDAATGENYIRRADGKIERSTVRRKPNSTPAMR